MRGRESHQEIREKERSDTHADESRERTYTNTVSVRE